MLLTILTVLALLLAVFFSLQRRTFKDPHLRLMGQALTNIAMGSAVLLLALNQFLFPDLTTARLTIAFLFLFLGLVNIWMGLKNYRFHRSNWQKAKRAD